MRVLVACEFSGTVRDAFAARGHDAWSCDLLPTERDGQHLRGNVLPYLSDGWDLIIAHPPCTYLSFAGNRHWNAPGRAELRAEALAFFTACLNAPCPRICVENPLGEPIRAVRPADQVIEPFYFGDHARKRTYLWLKGLPRLAYALRDDLFGPRTAVDPPKPVWISPRTGQAFHFTDMQSGKNRAHLRSRTFPGIAAAMADQWGAR